MLLSNSFKGEGMVFNGFKIECDVNVTQAYRDKYNEPCICDECTLFREYFKSSYPTVTKQLEQFGIDVLRPLEIIDLGFNTRTSLREYMVYFSVKGQLPIDKIESKLEQLTIVLRNCTIADEAYDNTGMERPYFIVEVKSIFLKDTKSEFYEAIRCGREIEFNYRGKHYFESRHGSKRWHIYCEETKQHQYFTTADELVLNAKLEGENMNDVWEDITIDCIL